MENKKNKAIGNLYSVSDKIKQIYPYKVYHKVSPHYGKEILVIETENNKINVLDEYLEDKGFLNELETGLAIDKKFRFTIIKQGKYLVRVEKLKD